jgi:hypothetical protein
METKRGIRTILFVLLGVMAVWCAGCTVRTQPGSSPVAVQATPGAPDYALAENWVWCGIGEGKAADLFIICPTVDMQDETNLSLDDERTKAAFAGALAMERGIYEDTARLYAPFYRQASMKAYGLPGAEREAALAFAYRDIAAAFERYLAAENGGRPIILAGFSQGADMCYRLLADYFGDDGLRSRLVAVYAIGWPCTREIVRRHPQILPARGADDTGVVVSFDCEAPDAGPSFINPARQKAYGINPLNWRTDAVPADRSKNLGACFTDYSGAIRREIPALCGAILDPERGVVKVPGVSPSDYPPIVPGLPVGAYHVYDYQFFFRNLQENVRLRTERFLATTAAEE